MSAWREVRALWSRCLALGQRIEQPQRVVDAGVHRQLDDCIEELTSAVRRLGSAGMLTAAQAGALGDAAGELAAVRAQRRPLAEALARYRDSLRTLAVQLRIPLFDVRPAPPWQAAAEPRELIGLAVDPLPPGPAREDPSARRHNLSPAAVTGAGAQDAAGHGVAAARGEDADGTPARLEPGAGVSSAPTDDTVVRSASDSLEALAFVTAAAARGGHLLSEFTRARASEGYQLSARCRECGHEVRLGRGSEEWWFAPIAPCARTSADAAVPTGVP